MFVDRAALFVKGGDGGNGIVSFRKEKYVPRGGPNGGDGGNGGSVILRATAGLTNLAHLSHQRHWVADRGEHGQGKDCHGRSGATLVIPVPPGTIVRDRDAGYILRDLSRVGDEVVIARGGRGGHGNTFFKSSTNRAPRQAERGEIGEERWIVLELKLIADVGLIGLPNAGKSTLLSRISRARPEIADYPFTTKYPNLGVVQVGDESVVVADIPGLIEGAHEGHGLGHEFLRHDERTRLLVHLIEAEPSDGSDPLANYRTIRDELARYSAALAGRPEIVVVTKLDLTGSAAVLEAIRSTLGTEVLGISAVSGRGIPALLARMAERLAELRPAVEPPSAAADEMPAGTSALPALPTPLDAEGG
jgi:GTP-binding protein